jgi:hypothetical protein
MFSQLIVNGTFATDSDWTKGTGWTISGGAAVATNVNNARIQQTIPVVAGRKYKFTWQLVSRTEGQFQSEFLKASNSSIFFQGTETPTPGIYTETITIPDGETSIIVSVRGRFGSGGADGTIDNLRLQKLSPFNDIIKPADVPTPIFNDIIRTYAGEEPWQAK